MNAFDQFTKYTLGNGLQTTRSYDDFLGLMSRTKSGAVEDLVLSWHYSNGTLLHRVDFVKSRIEFFTHDNLNRLTAYHVFGYPSLNVNYSSNGNITSKTDAGTYTYNPSKPHAVQSVTDPLGLMPLTQNITYTAFKRPETVTEGDYELIFTYGPENQRKKSVLKHLGAPQRTITYAGNYEKIETGGNTYEVHYIVAGPGLVAINVRQNGGTDNLFYVYTDHLGSILTLTDNTGAVVYEQNFDPWGRERNPNTWNYTANPNTKPPWLIRGFTGHEHHDEVELINMNARLYDPIVARMLSPDNFVQDATSTQGFNRYSYVLNNPLVYVDPSGELPFLIPVIIGFFAGGYIGGAIQQGTGGLSGANWNPFGGKQGAWDKTAWQGIAVGAIAGAGIGLGVSAGAAALGGKISGIAAKTGVVGAKSFSSAPSAVWYITSNALITANISMASTFAQGGDWERVAKSGLIGLGAGALGSALGYGTNYGTLGKPGFSAPKYQTQGLISPTALRLQVATTATIIGGTEAGITSYERGNRGEELFWDVIWGAGIGLASSYLSSTFLYGLNAPYINQGVSLLPTYLTTYRLLGR